MLSRRKFLKTTLLISPLIVLSDAFWFEKFFIETKEFFLTGATRTTQNLKLVQISDLHLQKINYPITQLINKINKIQPDLILITGGVIDKADNLDLLSDFLKLIDKNLKKVAILGNWEYWGKVNLAALEKIYSENNCTLLINQTQQFSFQNKTISITGVDDFLGGKPDIEVALKNYAKSDYHIVLNHCPKYSDEIVRKINLSTTPVDFILSGHTHGGQINFFGFAPFLPSGSAAYVRGWYDNNSIKIYVSKGIGTSILPVRLGARAEIAVFNLLGT